MFACGMPLNSVRANLKLAISGGQNEPRDAVAGTVWASLPTAISWLESSTARSPKSEGWRRVYPEYLGRF
jgi:hypothetical protein